MRNNRGNAVMLALGCLAVIAAVAIEASHRVKVSRDRAKPSALRDEAEVIMEAFSSRLQNPDDCTDALSGNVIVPGERSDVTLNYVLDPEAEPGAASLKAGSVVTLNGMRLTSLKLEAATEEDFRTEILDINGVSVELRRYQVYLQAGFADMSGTLVKINRAARLRADGSQELDLGIPFYVWALPPPPVGSGEIQSCFGRNSAGTLCNELGGYFIPRVRPYDQSCRQSLKTLKRIFNPTGSGTVLVPVANCRIGGIASTPAGCPKWGVAFGASQINGQAGILPNPGARYLCQVCQ